MMTTFTDWDIIRNLLLAGRWTVLLSLVAFTGGALVTLPLLLLRLTGGRQVKRLIRGYVELFQGDAAADAAVSGIFRRGAVRHRRLGMDRGVGGSDALYQRLSAGYLVRQHSRAAERPVGSLALSRAELRPDPVPVVAPQALRIAIAPTVGFAVQVIKGTALASIIGFVELTKAGTMLTNVTYQPFKVFALVALGYFILCYPLSRYSRYLENKFNASHHH